MIQTQISHLVKMANQIALNLSAVGSEDEIAAETARHIHKFWTPAMVRKLREYIGQGGEDCSPLVVRAAQEQL